MTQPHILKVGIPISLSGQFQAQGRQALAGLQTWAEDVNQQGGVWVSSLGASLPVSVIYFDDASNAEMARSITERLIVEDRVDLLMGPYSSVLSQAAAGAAERYGYVLWNQGGASDSIYRQGYQWVVGILTPASEYLAGLAQLVKEAAPVAETLAIVRAATGAFPRAVSSGAENQAVGLGFKIVLRREYPPAITDFAEILDEVEQVRPDVLLGVGRIRNDLLLSRQIAQRRLSLGAVVVVATPIQQFRDALGEDAEGFIGPSQWEPSGSYPHCYGPPVGQALESLRRSNYPLDYPMAQAYAAGLVAQRCVEAAGVLEQRALREAANTLDFSTFYGRFKIDPATGRQIGRSVVIIQWQQGRKVIVWPPEQRQASLVYPWR
jgi:branched-chain amino acid transport system substrate-binding protein